MGIIEHEYMELTRDLDPASFWKENEACGKTGENKPRCALQLSPDDHWLFEFVDTPSTVRYYHDKEYRDGLHQEANRVTREHVGRSFFDEDSWVHGPRRIENLFGSEFSYTEGGTAWLGHVTDDPIEFGRILDRAERTEMAGWALTPEFLKEWEERRAAGKPLPKLGTGSRGPATIMTTVLHPETAITWMMEEPDLMARFRDVLAAKMVELNRALRTFSGMIDTGWWITDDNCALFSPSLYRTFCVPVLRQVLEALAPGSAGRYQHSDSAMAHLLDDQRELGINSVNYGPTLDAALIRAKMPDAVIHGHTPPFLLRNGSPEEIRERVVSDFKKAGAGGKLVVTTAGSLAAGTGVGRIRWYMKLVRDHCRYE